MFSLGLKLSVSQLHFERTTWEENHCDTKKFGEEIGVERAMINEGQGHVLVENGWNWQMDVSVAL
jgi:hypothetical protein